jgi:hypothetical protein
MVQIIYKYFDSDLSEFNQVSTTRMVQRIFKYFDSDLSESNQVKYTQFNDYSCVTVNYMTGRLTWCLFCDQKSKRPQLGKVWTKNFKPSPVEEGDAETCDRGGGRLRGAMSCG